MKYTVRTTIIIIFSLFLALSFRGNSFIPDHPITEDSFYSLAVARNISQGNFFTVDGHSLTNGFQPLFTVICAIPYCFIPESDLITPLRFVLLIGLICLVLSGIMFSEIASTILSNKQDKTLFFLIFFSLALNVSIFFNGLETGMLTFMLMADWLVYLKTDFKKVKSVIFLGLLLGLTALTRIDAIWLCVTLSFSMFFQRKNERKVNLRNFLILSITSFIIELPWLLYNYFIFGSIMPTSGKAQMIIAFDMSRIYYSLTAVLQLLLPNSYLWDRFLTGISGFIIRLSGIALFLLLIIRQKNILSSIGSNKQNLPLLISFSVFGLILIIWYTLTSWSVHFYLRYLTPILILGLLFEISFLYSTIKNRNFLYAIVMILSLPTIAGVFFLNAHIKLRPSVFLTGQVKLVEKYVKPEEKVAARQSGTLCYFKKNVVNCDGKVNNEVFKYSGRMKEYLNQNDIRWFCDWKIYADTVLGKNPGSKGWVMVDSLKDFLLYHKIK